MVKLKVACFDRILSHSLHHFLLNIHALSLAQANKGTSIAFLQTPTDCHVINEEAWKAAQSNLKNAPLWQKLFVRGTQS